MNLFDDDESKYIKRPREYMRAYFRAGDDREKQKQALAGCPKQWQELVKTHIKIRRERMK